MDMVARRRVLSCVALRRRIRCERGFRPMSNLRFYRAILSRNFIARQSCSMQLSCRTLRLCRINKKWPISLTSACLCDKVAVCDMTQLHAATLSRDKIAGVNAVLHRQVVWLTPKRYQRYQVLKADVMSTITPVAVTCNNYRSWTRRNGRATLAEATRPIDLV